MIFALFLIGTALATGPDLDVRRPAGIEVQPGSRVQPDAAGVIARVPLRLPPFKAACFFSTDRRSKLPAGANRILPWVVRDLADLKRPDGVRNPAVMPPNPQATFALLRLASGRWLALLPLVGDESMAWLEPDEQGRLSVVVGTFGTEAVSAERPVLAWAQDADVYTACRKVWASALKHPACRGRTDWRNRKPYPEIFEYLGWCSWEEYKTEISSDLLVEAAHRLEKSHLPFRWLLVDDGHNRVAGRQLLDFGPDPQKFPQGFAPLLALRHPDRLRWMGLWLNFNGYWDGVAPENTLSEDVRAMLVRVDEHTLMPRPQDALPFYRAYLGAAADAGFDFIKIDDQAANTALYKGTSNAVVAGRASQEAKETVARERFHGLINCMAHNGVSLFNTRYSAVTRCSIDYKVGHAPEAKSHLMQSYHNMLWLGPTMWGDHDMFHSSDAFAGRMMAVSKALSGGPVYLSDAPEKVVTEYVRPLCYEDGRLLRPLAPAVVMPDSVMLDAINDARAAYRVMAPLPNGSLAIAAYNLIEGDEKNLTVRGAVSAQDYALGSAMMLPRRNPWRIPREGLIVYDWYAGQASKLEGEHAFELKGFSDKLLLLCPVQRGWAVIGRPDKYLAPAAVERWRARDDSLEVTMRESGPLLLWSERGAPTVDGATVERVERNLYRVAFPVEPRPRVVRVRRLPVAAVRGSH